MHCPWSPHHTGMVYRVYHPRTTQGYKGRRSGRLQIWTTWRSVHWNMAAECITTEPLHWGMHEITCAVKNESICLSLLAWYQLKLLPQLAASTRWTLPYYAYFLLVHETEESTLKHRVTHRMCTSILSVLNSFSNINCSGKVKENSTSTTTEKQ